MTGTHVHTAPLRAGDTLALWGGCLEILDLHLEDGRYLPSAERLQGAVLFVETSEELPSAADVLRMLRSMGELGLLERFSAVVAARPKAWSFDVDNDPVAKQRYCDEQHEAVLQAVAEYNAGAVVVLDVDVGHTDPQLVLPHGGAARLDPVARTIHVTF